MQAWSGPQSLSFLQPTERLLGEQAAVNHRQPAISNIHRVHLFIGHLSSILANDFGMLTREPKTVNRTRIY
jgi:hypothetical protein